MNGENGVAGVDRSEPPRTVFFGAIQLLVNSPSLFIVAYA